MGSRREEAAGGYGCGMVTAVVRALRIQAHPPHAAQVQLGPDCPPTLQASIQRHGTAPLQLNKQAHIIYERSEHSNVGNSFNPPVCIYKRVLQHPHHQSQRGARWPHLPGWLRSAYAVGGAHTPPTSETDHPTELRRSASSAEGRTSSSESAESAAAGAAAAAAIPAAALAAARCGTPYIVKRYCIDHFVNRAQREARLQLSMHHPNVLAAWAAVRGSRHFYLVIEPASHDMWHEAQQRAVSGAPYSDAELRCTARQLLAALDHLHTQHGLAHRDVKPHNLLRILPHDTDPRVTSRGCAGATPRCAACCASSSAERHLQNSQHAPAASCATAAAASPACPPDVPASAPGSGASGSCCCGRVALADLGWAERAGSSFVAAGTPQFLPPECMDLRCSCTSFKGLSVLPKGYDQRWQDMWAVGVTLAALWLARLPNPQRRSARGGRAAAARRGTASAGPGSPTPASAMAAAAAARDRDADGTGGRGGGNADTPHSPKGAAGAGGRSFAVGCAQRNASAVAAASQLPCATPGTAGAAAAAAISRCSYSHEEADADELLELMGFGATCAAQGDRPLSEGLTSLLAGLLRMRPSERLTVSQALAHPWVTGAALAPHGGAPAAAAAAHGVGATDAVATVHSANTTAPAGGSGSSSDLPSGDTPRLVLPPPAERRRLAHAAAGGVPAPEQQPQRPAALPRLRDKRPTAVQVPAVPDEAAACAESATMYYTPSSALGTSPWAAAAAAVVVARPAAAAPRGALALPDCLGSSAKALQVEGGGLANSPSSPCSVLPSSKLLSPSPSGRRLALFVAHGSE